MIYLNKVIAAFLLPPGLLLVLLAAVNVRLYRRKKGIANVLAVLLAIFYLMTTSFFSDGILRGLESQYTLPAAVEGDVIVMLGGGATVDTPDMDGIGNLSGTAANRLLTAARLQKKLNLPVIVSGGQVFAYTGTEAVIAKRLLVGLGIPAEKIIVEDQSLNTTQNALHVKKIMEAQGFKQPILVTSAFHMPRSVMNFEKAGLQVVPYPADYRANVESHISVFNFLPSGYSFQDTCTALWEYVGMLALKVQGM